MNDIKSIPESSKSDKLWIVLLKDLGDYALYFNKTDNCFAGFEVHKIRIREARECNIKLKDGIVKHLSIPKRRVIASSEDFGKYAWHYPNIDLVYERYSMFKEHKREIEIGLKEALISIQERVSRVDIDKTTMVGSKSLNFKVKVKRYSPERRKYHSLQAL